MAFAVFVAGCTHVPVNSAAVVPPKESAAVLGEGDVIEVRVFDELELSGTHQINSGGTIRLPLAGTFKIGGLTPEEAASKIGAEYEKKYLKHAQVTVFVQEFNSRKVIVLGEVKNPGPYPFEENMTVIGAIARAGGTNTTGAPNRTMVTREIGGKPVRMTAKVADIGRGEAPDISLQPGDIVFVPESFF